MTVTAFCDIRPCIPFEVDRRVRGAYCLHLKGDESAIHHLNDGSSTHL
jgi:hypothetical protein